MQVLNNLPSVKLFNTMSRSKEELKTLEEGKVSIYCCGPTVYDFFHLGNARPFVIFDVFRRLLKHIGYEVNFVQNFTDIDDKVIRRALEEGVSFETIAQRYIQEYFKDADGLNITRANKHPKATESMAAILDMIEKLMQKGHAYVTKEGVYFDVRSYKDYGKLSHYHLEDLQEGASERIEANEDKRFFADFALWKFKKEGEPFWNSPWGDGRPGWHIECSAMIYEHLNNQIDIHCGGQDLIFPHHENEIAQSECACCKPFAKYWLHNGFINVNYEKMSKSKKNFFTVRTLAEKFSYDILRYFILTAHYRSPINFSDDLLQAGGQALQRFRGLYEELSFILKDFTPHTPPKLDNRQEVLSYLQTRPKDEKTSQALLHTYGAVLDALCDDLNTPEALGICFEFVRAWNTELAQYKQTLSENRLNVEETNTYLDTFFVVQQFMKVLASLLGIQFTSNEVPQTVLDLVEARKEAKKNKDFEKADVLRESILKLGYQVMDTAQGPRITKL